MAKTLGTQPKELAQITLMLVNALEHLEKHLAQKLLERMYWWSTRQWRSVVTLASSLAEAKPLWQCTDSELVKLRLFGVTPEQLQEEIQHYWKRPTWQRWLWRLLSSIDKKISLWLYYQKCLTFRDLRKPETALVVHVDSQLAHSSSKQSINRTLVSWLKQNELWFESHIEKQFREGFWSKERFESEVAYQQAIQKRKFAKQLKRLLARSPDSERAIVERQVNASYRAIEETLQKYRSMWYHRVASGYFSHHHRSGLGTEQERRLVAYAGSSVHTTVATTSYSEQSIVLSGTMGLNFSNAEAWFKVRRQGVIAVIENKQVDSLQKVKLIKSLLGSSFTDIKVLIEPQINCYQQMLNETPNRDINHYHTAMQFTLRLQVDFIKFYKQALLLFHPDHYYDLCARSAINVLMGFWNDVFVRFKRHTDESMEQLRVGQEKLETWFSHTRFGIDSRLEMMSSQLAHVEQGIEELEKSYQELRNWFAQADLEWQVFLKGMEERAKEREAKMKEEMEKEAREREVKLEERAKEREAKMKEEMNKKEEQSKEREAKMKADLEERAKERGAKMKAGLEKEARERWANLEEQVRVHAIQIGELNSKMDYLLKHFSTTLPQTGKSPAIETNQPVFSR